MSASGGGTVRAAWAVLVLWAVLALWAAPARAMDDEMKELAKMLRENCAAETGVDVSLLAAVDAGGELPADDKLKCYIKCTMETAGMFSDGAVDVEAVVALLPDDFRQRNEASLRKCDTQKGSDVCDTAFQTQLCWQKANRKDYFLI